MALSIKDEETDRLVRKLARLRKTSFTGAIRLAVSNELNRKDTDVAGKRPTFMEAVAEAQRLYREMPKGPPVSDDDILGYDELGIPSR